MPRFLRRFTRPTVAFAHDVVMAAASFVLSLYLRVGDQFASYGTDFLLLGTAVFALVAAGIYLWMDLYRGIWRYASLNDLAAIAQAVTLIILVFLPVMFLTTRLHALPRSLVIINWFVLMTLLAAPRIAYRLLKDGRFDLTYNPAQGRRVDVLLVGTGDGAEMFIQAMGQGVRGEYRAVGIVDTGDRRIGRHICGVKVMGRLEDLPQVVDYLDRRGQRPQRLIVTKPEITGEPLRQLVEAALQLGMTVARLPQITEFRAASGQDVEIRPVALEDLLGRPQNVLDREAMRTLVAGRRVMVTGAGGTIGTELARQIAAIGPARLTLVDSSEFNLYSVDMELAERAPAIVRRAILADVRNRERIGAVMGEERPELVFHAAALKHVPMVETHPIEGVLTNVVGTRNVAEACRAVGAAAMVLISTDKAVNPTSVMGATKRLAEGYCQALDVSDGSAGATRFITVRFGNVLGSTGSVVPLFQRQLASGGPLTVTHPEIKRYFMTVREAVELVLQASALGLGRRSDPRSVETSGKIFVLDMGEPVRILDLARQMIRLAGLRPDRDVQITFTGLRPGEKLNEELFHAGERLQPTVAKSILLASPRAADYAIFARGIDELEAASRAGRVETTIATLQRLVPEYRPDQTALGTARLG